MDALLSRITIDPAVCHGKPCVRGLRYPVETLLELLSSGMTIDAILADYEDLERDDFLAVPAFAARLVAGRDLLAGRWDMGRIIRRGAAESLVRRQRAIRVAVCYDERSRGWLTGPLTGRTQCIRRRGRG